MTRGIIFDLDGMIVLSDRFSARLARKYEIDIGKTVNFFKNEFQEYIIGKADLKKELSKTMSGWEWKGTLDELLAFWFDDKENAVDERFK